MDPQRHQSDMQTQQTSIVSGNVVYGGAGGAGGHHTQKRQAKRLQSSHSRRASGITTASQSQRANAGKLTTRHSVPSKGIYVIKSKIGA